MYNSSEGYAQIKKELGNALANYGFRRYKTATLYRVTDGEVLQFINFQKGERFLRDHMTINIVIQPLFSTGCSFEILQPGGRLGLLTPVANDHWWLCDSEASTATSIAELKNIVSDKLIPFFDNTGSPIGLYRNFSDGLFRHFWSNHYTFITKGYICLKVQYFNEALAIFEGSRTSQVPKFKTIKNLIENEQFAAIDQLLTDNVAYSKNKLKI